MIEVEVDNYGIVKLAGSESWRDGWAMGTAIDEAFPGQDALDFGTAIHYHGHGPLTNKTRIKNFVMLVQGANDEKDWIWFVEVERMINGAFREHGITEYHVLRGGCDYTGWDCQSSATWTEIKD